MHVENLISYLKSNNLEDKRVFISGPVSSRKERYKEYFNKVVEELEKAGIDYYNPANIPGKHPWQVPMQITLSELLKSDIIFMLKGWESSNGAKAEFAVAQICGITILYED